MSIIINIKKQLRKLIELSKENQEYLANQDEDNKEPDDEIDKKYLMGFSDGIIFAVTKIKITMRGEENSIEMNEQGH